MDANKVLLNALSAFIMSLGGAQLASVTSGQQLFLALWVAVLFAIAAACSEAIKEMGGNPPAPPQPPTLNSLFLF